MHHHEWNWTHSPQNKSLFARDWFWNLVSSCSGWVLKCFREQQWSTYDLPRTVLTSGDAEVNKPSNSQCQSQLGKRPIVGENCPEGTGKSLPFFRLRTALWCLEWNPEEQELFVFAERGKVFQGERTAGTTAQSCDGDLTSPGTWGYSPIGGI